jgi:hypothetical protein
MTRVLQSLALVAILFAVAHGANNTTVAGNVGSVVPSDVSWIEFYDNDITDAADSIGPDSNVVFGPYKLTDASGEPMYEGFQILCKMPFTASGDSIDILYSLCNGNTLADTTTWKMIDTLAYTESCNYVSLDSAIAPAIAFKFHGFDATQVVILGRIRAYFRKAMTWNKNR